MLSVRYLFQPLGR